MIKTLRITAALGVLLLATFVVLGQKPEAPAGAKATRYSFIDLSKVRDRTAGIRAFGEIAELVDKEFERDINQLKASTDRARTIINENQSAANTHHRSIEFLEKKRSEYESLVCNIRDQREQFTARYDSRFAELSRPVNDPMRKALEQYATENGYSMIVDINSVVTGAPGISVSVDLSPDITRAFILHFNNRYSDRVR